MKHLKSLTILLAVILCACAYSGAENHVEQWCEKAREAARQVAEAPAGIDINTLDAVLAMQNDCLDDTTRLTAADRVMIRETNSVLVDAVSRHISKSCPGLSEKQLKTGREQTLTRLNTAADTASTLGSYLRAVDRP